MAGAAPLRPLGWRAPEKVFIEASLFGLEFDRDDPSTLRKARVLIETTESEDAGSGVRLPKRIEVEVAATRLYVRNP